MAMGWSVLRKARAANPVISPHGLRDDELQVREVGVEGRRRERARRRAGARVLAQTPPRLQDARARTLPAHPLRLAPSQPATAARGANAYPALTPYASRVAPPRALVSPQALLDAYDALRHEGEEKTVEAVKGWRFTFRLHKDGSGGDVFALDPRGAHATLRRAPTP
eukprot:659006-Prymnesium_polylepis.1